MLKCLYWGVFQTTQKFWAAWGNLWIFFFQCLGINRIPEKWFLGCSKTNWQVGNFYSALWFPGDYIGWFFPFLLKNWGTWNILMLKKISSMLKKFCAVFKKFKAAQEYYKGWKKIIVVLNFWLFWKILMLESFLAFCEICVLHDNLVPCKNWRKFSFVPKHFGHIGKFLMLQKFQAVQEFVCRLITLGRLYGLNKIFVSCPQFWVLSLTWKRLCWQEQD